MSSKDKPERITLSHEEAEALKIRVRAGILLDNDKKILVGLIAFTLWLQQQLNLATLSIHRLKRLFGFSTEKKSPKSALTDNADEQAPEETGHVTDDSVVTDGGPEGRVAPPHC
ncbi:MAG: hypothetical protein K2Q14_01715 [Gammaproteobacteria bacterium]|nr:hypothetical protein [Gammaproteobacteria bacterium]